MLALTCYRGMGFGEDAVPAYRDGQQGQRLQQRMVEYATLRATEYAKEFGRNDVFSNADNWVAYARLMPVITTILQTKFGTKPAEWPDPARTLTQSLTLGEPYRP